MKRDEEDDCPGVFPGSGVEIHDDGCPTGQRKERERAAAGPAKVTSNAYRSGWEGIFGAKTVRGQA